VIKIVETGNTFMKEVGKLKGTKTIAVLVVQASITKQTVTLIGMGAKIMVTDARTAKQGDMAMKTSWEHVSYVQRADTPHKPA
jgi:hypothetical protein